MRLTLSLLIAISVAACGVHPSPSMSPGSSGPLEAWIVPHELGGVDGNSIHFFVSRPAHVAVFQIVPGGGAALIYPRHSGEARMHYAGFSSGYLGSPRARRMMAQFAFLPAPRAMSGFGPQYFLLVASEEPIEVGRFAASPMALRREIPSLTAMNVNRAASELVNLSFGGTPPPPDRWTYDLYVHWPMMPAPRTLAMVDMGRLVRCPDGSVIMVMQGHPAVCPAVDADTDDREVRGDEARTIRDYIDGRRPDRVTAGATERAGAITAIAERRERVRRTIEARERVTEMRRMEAIRERNRAVRDMHRSRATRPRSTRDATPAPSNPSTTQRARPARQPQAESGRSAPTTQSQEQRRENRRPPDSGDRDGAS